MKNKRIFWGRDFRTRFKKELDRFDVQKNGVYLAEVDDEGLTEAEAAALRDDPKGSLESPVLPFPFSYTDAERFADDYDLWGSAHMETLLRASGEVLTLDETSKDLGMDQYGAWAVMQPQNDPMTHKLLPVLQPSVFFDNIVLEWRGKDGGEMSGFFHGLFDLCNDRGLEADSRGVIRILFLERDGITYAVPDNEKKVVNISRLYVTRDNLREYLKEIGKDTPDMLADFPGLGEGKDGSGGIAPEKTTSKRQRTDPMAVEIDDILKDGLPPKVAAVWAELVKRCGPGGGCCLKHEERDTGLVITWRGAQGQIKSLTKKGLQSRLERLPR